MRLMLNIFRRRIVPLLVALGLVLSGSVSFMASPASAASMPCAMMMPGMSMPGTPAKGGKQAPMKNMPCDGTGCGCCVAGTCAMPSALIQEDFSVAVFASGKIALHNVSADGISHLPALPPPIA